MIQYTQDELVKIDRAVQEAADSMTRGKAETDFQKEVAERMKDELKFPTSDFNKLVKERFDEKISKSMDKLEEITSFHDELVNARRKVKSSIAQPTGEDENE